MSEPSYHYGLSEEIIMPENFSMVCPGVYRSSFPRSKSIPFLHRLGLKSVVSLVLEDYPKPLVDFYQRNGIELIEHGLEGNKGAFKEIDIYDFYDTISTIMKLKKRPLLIHCNKGKHRTGSVIGCLRKLSGWSFSSIVDEYILFAYPKHRTEDQRFIEAFSIKDYNEYIANKKKEKKRCKLKEIPMESEGDKDFK